MTSVPPSAALKKLPPATIHFKYSGAVAERHFGASGPKWTDAQGRPVDPEQLRLDNIHAFVQKTDRVDPALDAEASHADSVLADVWYGVRLPPMKPGNRDKAWRQHRVDVVENVLRGRAEPLTAQIRVAGGQVLDTDTIAPRLRIKASRAALHAIGHLPFVVRLDPVSKEPESPMCGYTGANAGEYASEDYVWATGAAQNILEGVTGAGVAVLSIEGGCIESWNNVYHEPPDPAGGCWDGFDTGSTLLTTGEYLCPPTEAAHCAYGASWKGHHLMTASAIRNSVTRFRGNAPGARVVYGMETGGYLHDLDWAFVNQDADILSWSEGGVSGGHQSVKDVQLDFAAYSLGILPVTGVGNYGKQCLLDPNTNQPTYTASNGLRNGLVIGASTASLPRSNVTTPPTDSCFWNFFPGNTADGWELPHLVAPGVNSIGAGIGQNTLETTEGCSSFAAPEVASIVAEAEQINQYLDGEPAEVMAGMIVSADQKIDQQAGQWLSLSDGHDDYDGAGLVDAALAVRLFDYANQDAYPSVPHATGYSSEYLQPSDPYRDYAVTIPPNATLRAASVVMSNPLVGGCDLDGNYCTWTNNPYPYHILELLDGNNNPLASSANADDNYQYLTYPNNTPDTVTVELHVGVYDFDGLNSASLGIAWTSDTWQEPETRFGPAQWWSWPAVNSSIAQQEKKQPQSAASDFGNDDLGANESQWGSITFGDLDGDGLDDVCARNDNDGLFCALNRQNGAFGNLPPAQEAQPRAFTQKQTFANMMHSGWGTPDHGATLRLAKIQHPELDGTRKADICGRASTGIVCAHSDSHDGGIGFGNLTQRTSGVDFSDSDTRADFQTDPTAYLTIAFADVNDDDYPDVCARFHTGVHCAMNDGFFGTFLPLPSTLSNTAFSDSEGWSPEEYGDTIRFGDVNNDGYADVCGRFSDGIYCAMNNGIGGDGQPVFSALERWTSHFSDAEGWGSMPSYYKSLTLVDINHDGYLDMCGRGKLGIVCDLSDKSGVRFSDVDIHTVYPYDFTNAYGWNQEKYGDTIRFPYLGDDNVSPLRPASKVYPAVCGRASYGLRCALNREYN